MFYWLGILDSALLWWSWRLNNFRTSSPVSFDDTTLLPFPPSSPFILRMELRSIEVMSWWHFSKHFSFFIHREESYYWPVLRLMLKGSLFVSKQPPNQWTWNHALGLSLTRLSCATFPVLLKEGKRPLLSTERLCPLQNSYAEALTSSVAIFGDGAH